MDGRGDFDLARTLTCDGARCGGGFKQGALGDLIRIRESGFVARYGTYTNALINRETTCLDDTLLQAPALALGELEIEIGVINLVRKDGTQHLEQMTFVQSIGRQQDLAGNVLGLEIGFDEFHSVG